jgi:DNA-binding CsgD family transcriptional regulator
VEVLRAIAQGLSNREIADQLVISETTVKTHVNNILIRPACVTAPKRSPTQCVMGWHLSDRA